MTARHPALVALTAIAGLEGVALIAYSVSVAVEGLRDGTSGPAEVSNVPAMVSIIGILAILGAGMVVIASGWWRSRGWARAPFVLAQLIAGLIGWEVSQSERSVEHAVGLLAIGVAVVGLVLAFTPPVSRAISDEG